MADREMRKKSEVFDFQNFVALACLAVNLFWQLLSLLPFRSKKVGFCPYFAAFLVRTPPFRPPIRRETN
ncbi:MAG TPA: hypothetical protein PK971_11360, partial [Saprospiraceae bacterium]|nr:hypothetical protein [Saprospiraceae bacterium]